MKIASLFLSLLVLAAPLRAQPLPGDSVYHLQATTQDAGGRWPVRRRVREWAAQARTMR